MNLQLEACFLVKTVTISIASSLGSITRCQWFLENGIAYGRLSAILKPASCK